MPVCERFSSKPATVRTKSDCRADWIARDLAHAAEIILEPIDEEKAHPQGRRGDEGPLIANCVTPAFLQSPRNHGHVLECGGAPLLCENASLPSRPPDFDADPKAAEHRRTPKRKRNIWHPWLPSVSI